MKPSVPTSGDGCGAFPGGFAGLSGTERSAGRSRSPLSAWRPGGADGQDPGRAPPHGFICSGLEKHQ